MKVTHAFLLVDDLDRAKKIYTQALGFEVETDHQGDGFRWLSLKGSGGAELVLDSVDDAGKSFLISRFEKGRPACSFTLDGPEEFERIREHVTVLSEPTRQEYGGTDALIDDGCGNIVCLHLD